MASVPVLIFQACTTAANSCLTDLPKAGFEEGKDFIMLESPGEASRHLDAQNEQLFVTGISYDLLITDVVKQLKSEHPKLKAAFFSVTNRYDTVFDLQIEKGVGEDFCKALISELNKFLNR